MTAKELKDYLISGRPVVYQEIEYQCVNGIIYRNNGGSIAVLAELLDRNNNCVVIAQPEKVCAVEEVSQ